MAWHLRKKPSGIPKIPKVPTIKPIKPIKPIEPIRPIKPIAMRIGQIESFSNLRCDRLDHEAEVTAHDLAVLEQLIHHSSETWRNRLISSSGSGASYGRK